MWSRCWTGWARPSPTTIGWHCWAIGRSIARARGPYGRRITEDDEQKLLLVAALLEIESQPDDVLVP